MDDHRRLAALAVFCELYSKRKNASDILKEFTIDMIVPKGLHSFYPATITTKLESEFGFRAPEAIVKNVLHKISKAHDWCSRQGQELIVSSLPDEADPEIKKKYADKQAANEGIFKHT